MTVPSNLVPTSITQLTEDPSPSSAGWMVYVNNGVTYKVQVSAVLNVSGVPTSRQVIAGTGLTGGGALSSNVTLSVAAGGIGATQLDTTGVTAGSYGNATTVPVVTVDANGRITGMSTASITVSGYVTTATQVIAGTGMTGGGALSSNVTLTADLSNLAPVDFGVASAGVSTKIARSDHIHPAVNLADLSQTEGALDLTRGGTGSTLTSPASGALVYSDGSALQVSSAGSSGQVLISGGTGAPTWGSALIVADQAANVVYAGPTSGAAAPTAFRALVNADLPASGATANTYGSSTAIPVLTVNSKGVITSASTVSFTGGLSYQGSWNASTNTPTLVSSTGTNGHYYIVSVAGSTNLDGITDWQVGDWAIFNGTTWQKIDQTNLVSSVNGYTGVVVLSYSDVGAPSTSGTNATGTWAIAISGNAATATSATTATNVAGGAANKIVYNTGSGATSFIDAPTSANTFLEWSGAAFQWATNPLGTVTSVGGTGTVSGITLTGTVTTSGNLTLGGALDLSSPPAIGGSSANAITGTIITASTKLVSPYLDATSSAGGALRNSSGTAQLQWGSGGGSNISVDVAINVNPANAKVDISPTGTGYVDIKPAGALTIVPTTAGTIDNMSVGATTAATGRFTTVESTVATGTAPLIVASTTQVNNLTAQYATTATNATNVAVTADATATSRYVAFLSATSGNIGVLADSDLSYNPSTNALTAGSYYGDISNCTGTLNGGTY